MVGGTAGRDAGGAPIHSVDVADLDRGTLARIPVSFLAHGVAVDPQRPSHAAVFEKWGSGAALVDLAGGRFVAPIAPTAGRHFYGHGTFTRGGEELLVVETDLATKMGVISVRERTTLAPVGELPSFGAAPHDCVLFDGGRTLVVTNGGGPLGTDLAPSVAYIDVATRALKELVTFSDPKINAGHIALADDGSFAVCSAPRNGLAADALGGITLRRGRRKPERMRAPKAVFDRLLGESLSVVVRGRTAAVTTPVGGLVTFWDLDRQKLVHTIDLERPRGLAVTQDGALIAIAYGNAPRLCFVDGDTFAPVAIDGAPREGCFSGSHLFLWREGASLLASAS